MRKATAAAMTAGVAACSLFPDLGGLTLDDASTAYDVATDVHDAMTSGDSGCAAIERVATQSWTAPGFASSQTITIAVTSGNLLVAIVGAQYAGMLSVHDSAQNTWTRLPQQDNASCVTDAAPWATRAIWYATADSTDATDTVSLTTTSTDDLTLTVVEYAAAAPLAFETSAGEIATSSSTTETAGPLSLTGCANVIVCMFADEGPTGTYGLPPGYTSLANVTDWSFAAADNLDVDAGVATPTATIPGTGDSCWAVAAAAFKVGP